MSIFDFHCYSGNHNLFKHGEDNFVFLTQKVSLLFLIDKKCAFAEKPQTKINSLKIQKHEYLIHTWSDKAFKETVVKPCKVYKDVIFAYLKQEKTLLFSKEINFETENVLN